MPKQQRPTTYSTRQALNFEMLNIKLYMAHWYAEKLTVKTGWDTNMIKWVLVLLTASERYDCLPP